MDICGGRKGEAAYAELIETWRQVTTVSELVQFADRVDYFHSTYLFRHAGTSRLCVSCVPAMVPTGHKRVRMDAYEVDVDDIDTTEAIQ